MNKLLAVGLVLLLTSCASTYSSRQSGAPTAANSSTAGTGVDASAPLATSAADLAQAKIDAEDEESYEPTLYRGNNRQVRVPPVEESIRFLGDDVTINFEQAPLSEVMHAIMGDILQLDYVVDQPITGEVTLRTRTPIPRDELFAVLESLLKANNVIIIRGEDGRYLVTNISNGTRVAPGVSNPRNTGVGFSTIIIPLKYISASNMAEILEPVAEPEAFVRVDNVRNLLMLAGTRGQLNGWLEMVQTFDVDLLAGMSVGIFPLENSNAEEVHEALSALLSNGDGDKEEGGDWSQLVRIIPIERLNSILVVTPRAHYLDIVQEWITRLDDAYQSDGDKRLYVYPAQNTSAERLAELLNSIYSGNRNQNRNASRDGDFGSSSSFSAFGNDASVAPGMNRESFGTSSLSGNFQPRSDNSGRGEGNRISSVSLAGGGDSILDDVRVVADPESNSLLIYSTGIQYRIIETALEQLDQEATQIIIEASIIEVTLNDDLRYGLEWTFSNEIGDDRTGTGLLTSTARRGLIEPINRGFSYSIVNSGGAIKAVLTALAEENLLNVISTPSVMVLDNHDAYIQVGDQVPVLTSTSQTDGGNVVENVQYRDTGVQLNVRPSVNAGGLVTMQVEQSVTDVGPSSGVNDNPIFLERAIMSRVAVRSNESVVLGGLIRENASNAQSGVPFLHTLPVVGPLFGSTVKENTRTELLVIITPRALYNEQDLREVSEEMRSQIRNMELIELPSE
ncbi:MAG: type II secretion system secretin GspD [Pseudomonadota bacterium]